MSKIHVFHREKSLAFPSSQRRGGCAERSEGADGVVRPVKRFAELTTPALRATPPLRGGEYCTAYRVRLKSNVAAVMATAVKTSRYTRSNVIALKVVYFM